MKTLIAALILSTALVQPAQAGTVPQRNIAIGALALLTGTIGYLVHSDKSAAAPPAQPTTVIYFQGARPQVEYRDEKVLYIDGQPYRPEGK